MKDQMTAAEVAERLNISRRTVYNWSHRWEYDRQGPKPRKFGGCLRYDRADVEAYIASCEKAS